MKIRLLLLTGVALGIAGGLLADRYIPGDSIWPVVVIGAAVGVAFFVLVKVIKGKGVSAI